MPKIIVSFASDALRVIAISSGSQPKSRGEVAAHGLDARLEHAPHVLHRQLVREAQVADHLLEHVRRRGRAAAVVEIDHRAVEVERALDLAPVRLVLGGGGRRTAARPLVGTPKVPKCVGPHGGQAWAV